MKGEGSVNRPLVALFALIVGAPLHGQGVDDAVEPSSVPSYAAWSTRYKAAMDAEHWAWLEESGVSAEVVDRLQESDLVSGEDVEAVRHSMRMDAEFIQIRGLTADYLLASFGDRLTIQGFATAPAVWYPPTDTPADAAQASSELDEKLWQALDEHRHLHEELPDMKAVDVLWASIAVDHDQHALELLRVGAHHYLMHMPDYRIVRSAMIDDVVDRIVAACDLDGGTCEIAYDGAALACETARVACELNPGRAFCNPVEQLCPR